MGRAVTEDEKLEFKRLYVEERLSTHEIAAKTGRAKTVIRTHLRRLGVQLRPQGSHGLIGRRVFPATRHGMRRHPHYSTWLNMMHRCYDSAIADFKNYGGRGIEVFVPWHDPRTYIEYVEVMLGPKPDGHTIDRIDNNGNYEPGNIQWLPISDQNRKRDLSRNA